MVEWKPYQIGVAGLETVASWWSDFGHKINLGFVTGEVSGIVVVDADSEEAINYCKKHGYWSPIRVKTSRGYHCYFKHPGTGHIGNRANMFGIKKLDLRGDGGYVVAPPSIHESGHTYVWEIEQGIDWDDMPVYAERNIREVTDENAHEFDPDDLDLTGVTPEGEPGPIEKYRAMVASSGKLREGDGRNVAVTEMAGELAARGLSDDQIADQIDKLCDELFDDLLDTKELNTTLRSVRQTDRRNHPDRYAPGISDRRLGGVETTSQVVIGTRTDNNSGEVRQDETIGRLGKVMSVEDILSEEIGDVDYLVEPWLPHPAIVQIFGYFSHGKSLLTYATMWRLAQGRAFGPYRMKRPARVLYIDNDMGARDIKRRTEAMATSFGLPGDNLMMWAGTRKETIGTILDPRKLEGQMNMVALIKETRPEVVVLDNIRNLCPGMDENDSKAWSPINEVCKKLRSHGISTIVIHHANKPFRNKEGRLEAGSEAGSGNQMTVLEVQMKVARIEEDQPKFLELEQQLPPGAILRHAMHVTYGKIRDRDPEVHEDAYIGMARRSDGGLEVVALPTKRMRAVKGYDLGASVLAICDRLKVTKATVEAWLVAAGYSLPLRQA